MNIKIRIVLVFIAGIIVGGIIVGIVAERMSSRMWIDIYTQLRAHDLTQETRALEELQKDNTKQAMHVLEKQIDSYVEHAVDELDISDSTKEKYNKAVTKAKEIRRIHPNEE